jgi:hypothetical protein
VKAQTNLKDPPAIKRPKNREMSGRQSIFPASIWITPLHPNGSNEDATGLPHALRRVRNEAVGDSAVGYGDDLPHEYRGEKMEESDTQN